MTLDAGAQQANVKRSVEQYCNVNLGTTEGFSIDFEGTKFDDTNVPEWVMPRVLPIESIFHRQSSNTQYGETARYILHMNIFVKKGDMVASDRHWIMRDKVANYFKIGEDISIADYVSGSTSQIAFLRIRSLVTDSPVGDSTAGSVGETQTLYQYAFAVEANYTRSTTEA